jgi:predicted RNA-binding protein with TRAM domain
VAAAVNILKKNNDSNKCEKCNLTIHPNFIGYHKCGYANCAICKNAITNSEYWDHIRSHPGHESDSPPAPRTTFGNRNESSSRSFSSSRGSADVIQLKVGNEYEVDITEISRQQGDGIARIQGCVIFVKGRKIGNQVKIIITEIRSRFAIARVA